MMILWIGTALLFLLTVVWRLRRAAGVLDAILVEEGVAPEPVVDRMTPGVVA